MKATIKIPAGWRRLRADERHVYGDRALNCQGAKDWLLIRRFFVGMITGEWPCIRRIARAKKWVPKGYVEITKEQWEESMHEAHSNLWRYSAKGERKLMTWGDWYEMGSLIKIENTRFWLRKGAK